MKKLSLDCGVQSYQVGQGVLRFNPADPNVYARFLDALDKLTALEKELVCSGDGQAVIECLRKADIQVKGILQEVFPGNDMEQIFGGVNLLAVGSNGERVITNFVAALEPVLTQGARQCAKAEAAKL